MMQLSTITGFPYNDENVVFFKNPTQSSAYCLWGAELIDIIPTEDYKFIYVFSKTDHDEFKHRWKRHCDEYFATKDVI